MSYVFDGNEYKYVQQSAGINPADPDLRTFFVLDERGQLRKECLRLATRPDSPAELIIADAKAFYDFIMGEGK